MNGFIELHENEMLDDGRRSSKGNQLKWQKDDFWYKADYCGYEGLAEYVTSELLRQSSLPAQSFVSYDTVAIRYRQTGFHGCASRNFLNPGDQLITLERLFMNAYHQSLSQAVFHIRDHRERLRFLVDQIISLTGLDSFGAYISTLMAIDALVLNEDRHMHNIAVILERDGHYRLSPIFDHGASLLSDTEIDYPLTMDVYEAIDSVQAKTISTDFEEQLMIAEDLYGEQIHFSFTENSLHEILDKESFYPDELKQRIFQVVMDRRRKYAYLFS